MAPFHGSVQVVGVKEELLLLHTLDLKRRLEEKKRVKGSSVSLSFFSSAPSSPPEEAQLACNIKATCDKLQIPENHKRDI